VITDRLTLCYKTHFFTVDNNNNALTVVELHYW